MATPTPGTPRVPHDASPYPVLTPEQNARVDEKMLTVAEGKAAEEKAGSLASLRRFLLGALPALGTIAGGFVSQQVANIARDGIDNIRRYNEQLEIRKGRRFYLMDKKKELDTSVYKLLGEVEVAINRVPFGPIGITPSTLIATIAALYGSEFNKNTNEMIDIITSYVKQLESRGSYDIFKEFEATSTDLLKQFMDGVEVIQSPTMAYFDPHNNAISGLLWSGGSTISFYAMIIGLIFGTMLSIVSYRVLWNKEKVLEPVIERGKSIENERLRSEFAIRESSSDGRQLVFSSAKTTPARTTPARTPAKRSPTPNEAHDTVQVVAPVQQQQDSQQTQTAKTQQIIQRAKEKGLQRRRNNQEVIPDAQ